MFSQSKWGLRLTNWLLKIGTVFYCLSIGLYGWDWPQ